MISLSDLIAPVTTAQQLEIFLTALESMGVPARSWRQAGSLRTILAVVAGVYAAFSSLAVQFISGGFLDLAAGGWLTLLAHYVYGVDRITATFATGFVTLVNSGGANYPGVQPGQLVVQDSLTGATYTNTAVFTLNASSTLTNVPVQASVIGSASSANPTDVSVVVSVMPGVSVTNPASIVGTDDEVDADLQQRCRDKLGTLSGLGPRSAYAFAVRSTVRGDGSTVDVNRLTISPSSSTGIVTIVVASSTGTVSGPDLTLISANIEATARPDTVTVNLSSATDLVWTPTLTVWATVTAGLDSGTLISQIETVLTALATAYPIGGQVKPPSTQGTLFASNIDATVRTASPAIFAIDGAVDLLMGPTDVPELTSPVITISFVQGAEGT